MQSPKTNKTSLAKWGSRRQKLGAWLERPWSRALEEKLRPASLLGPRNILYKSPWKSTKPISGEKKPLETVNSKLEQNRRLRGDQRADLLTTSPEPRWRPGPGLPSECDGGVKPRIEKHSPERHMPEVIKLRIQDSCAPSGFPGREYGLRKRLGGAADMEHPGAGSESTGVRPCAEAVNKAGPRRQELKVDGGKRGEAREIHGNTRCDEVRIR